MVEKISRKDYVKNGVLHRVNGERNILHTHNNQKDGHISSGTAVYNTLLKEL